MGDEDKGTTVSMAARFGAKIKDLTNRLKASEAKNTELSGQVTTLTTENGNLKQQVLSPDEANRKIAELTGKIRGTAHKAKFRELAKAAGASESAIDDLYDLSGHKAETDEPDETALKALIETSKTKRPYAFTASSSGEGGNAGDNGTTKPIPGQGRGGSNNGSDATLITAEQRADPKFMLNPANRELIAAAAKEGRFR